MMDKPEVWMTYPMSTYLQDKLSQHFTLIKSWQKNYISPVTLLFKRVATQSNSTLIHKLIRITLFSSNSQAYSHESAKNDKITRCDENKLIS